MYMHKYSYMYSFECYTVTTVGTIKLRYVEQYYTSAKEEREREKKLTGIHIHNNTTSMHKHKELGHFHDPQSFD